jgi:hypothetical protein
MQKDTQTEAGLTSHLTQELDTEPSIEWNRGCSDYYIGADQHHNPYALGKHTMQQEIDWDSGWIFAAESSMADGV